MQLIQSGKNTEDQQYLNNDNLFIISGQNPLNAILNDADGEAIKIYCLISSQFLLPGM